MEQLDDSRHDAREPRPTTRWSTRLHVVFDICRNVINKQYNTAPTGAQVSIADRWLSQSCEPDRVPAAVRVLGDMGQDVEAVLVEQGPVLRRGQAAVIEPLTLEGADCLAMPGPAGEHQRRARRSMLSEDREHRSLVFGGEMKETVPGDQPVEAALP